MYTKVTVSSGKFRIRNEIVVRTRKTKRKRRETHTHNMLIIQFESLSAVLLLASPKKATWRMFARVFLLLCSTRLDRRCERERARATTLKFNQAYKTRTIKEHKIHNIKKECRKKSEIFSIRRRIGSSNSWNRESPCIRRIVYFFVFRCVFLNLLRKCMWPVIAFYVAATIVFTSRLPILFAAQIILDFFFVLHSLERILRCVDRGIALALKFKFETILSVRSTTTTTTTTSSSILAQQQCATEARKYVIYRQECISLFFFYSFFVSIIIL